MPPLFTLSVLSGVILLSACASTSFTSTWKSSEVLQVNPRGHKVAAAFISTDESSRREAEDVLARKLTEQGASGVPAYTLVPSGELHDMPGVKARLTQAGIDGVVIMRILDAKERTTVTPGSRIGFAPHYMHFSGYWGYGWGAPYAPAQVTTTTVLRIETLVYSLERDALVWAGTSRTVNPARVSKFVAEIADSAVKQMKREGVLPAAGTVPGDSHSRTY